MRLLCAHGRLVISRNRPDVTRDGVSRRQPAGAGWRRAETGGDGWRRVETGRDGWRRVETGETADGLALGVIMECARCETPGKFSNELYEDALRRATRAKSWSEALLGTLKARYLTRVDVRYHTYGAMRKLAEELKTYAPGEGEAAAVDVARNVYDVLNATPRAFDDYRGDEAGAEDEDGRADFAAMLAKLRGESVDDEGEKKRGPWCEDAEGSVIDLEAAKKKRKTSRRLRGFHADHITQRNVPLSSRTLKIESHC